MQIEKHISHLLFEHDCVIIPNFGGFVGNYKSAKLDPIQNKFSPPSKNISFNRNLVHNDGLLANRISLTEKKTFAEASDLLKKYSEDLKNNLKLGRKLEFSQIGTIYSDEHQNLQFDPDNSSNFLMASFGLSAFHLIPVNKPVKSEGNSLREKAAEIKFVDRGIIDEPVKEISQKRKTVPLRKKKYFTLAAVILPVIFILLWVPLNIEKLQQIGQKAKSFNYSNLLPFIEKSDVLYSERLGISENIISINPESIISPISVDDTSAFTTLSLFSNEDREMNDEKKIVVILKKENSLPDFDSSEEKKNNRETGGKQKTRKFRFHIIGGCFQYFENAEKLVEELRNQGFNSAIIDKHKGLYRVGYQSFNSKKEAINLLAKVQANPKNGAWLLIK